MVRLVMTRLGCGVAGALLLAAPALAQSNAEINGGIQLNFSLPGARSLGMGGAFLGLSDDATAAYANPAGLTVLAKPEVSVEGRSWRFTNVFADRGHAFGSPTGIGLDTIGGIRTAETEDDTAGASFLSFVYPKDRWAFSVYRHELARFQGTIRTQGVFYDCNEPECGATPGLFRLFPVDASTDLDIVNYGVAVAYRIGEKFSVGAGLSYYDFSLDSITRRFDLGDFYGPPSYAAGNVVNFQTQDGDDTDLGFNLGLLWKPTPKLSIGAVYREGPDFDVHVASLGGPSRGLEGVVFVSADGKMHVPDVYGVGLAYRITDAFTVASELTRVQYGQMTDDVVNLFPGALDAQVDDYRVDDATELHVGMEYIFVDMTYPLALRLGSWYDPDHQVRFEGTDKANRILFREGDDEIHYAAGVGLVFGQRFQVDVAADLSDRIDVYSLSMVARF